MAINELRRAGLDALHECWLSAETMARIRRVAPEPERGSSPCHERAARR
jgi:hypothetical protein